MRDLRTSEGLSPFIVPRRSMKELTSLQRHMLNADEEHEWYYFGLPVSDLRYLLRAVLLCADEDENVFLDLSGDRTRLLRGRRRAGSRSACRDDP